MLKVVSFNVRYPNIEDGMNYFPCRLPRIVGRIRREQPDIIGFQELTEDSALAMSALLPDYTFVGHGRQSDLADPRGESVRIAFKKDRFVLFTYDCGWLSNAPYQPASCFADQSDCPRVYTTVRLFDKTNRHCYLMTNVHLDHVGAIARDEGLRQVFAMQKTLKTPDDSLCLVTGDFNFPPDEYHYRLIGENGYQDLAVSIPTTNHEFATVRRGRIDYILTDRTVPFTLTTWNKDEEGRPYSDHEAFVAEIDI